MTDREINAAMARVLNWKTIDCNDLNAMHEAESILTEKQKRTFAFNVSQVLDTSPTVDLGDQFLNIHATARQRAEAFLRTLGKWKETK
jgi:hypothetical protein